jgi:hypothetical protein
MSPPPLLGYNNNVRHRGRVFHIQTEDSGTATPRIKTHLFADGGRIVKSTRTDYSEFLERDDMSALVKNMMKEQHKAMFVALRSGELDELIGFGDDEPVTQAGMALNPLSEQFLREAQARAASAPPSSASVSSGRAAALPRNEVRPEQPIPAAATQVRVLEVNAELFEIQLPPIQPPPPTIPSAKPYAPSRPASIFSVPASTSSSIFGEVGIDERSLDDAILSYLAEDEDSSASKK